MTSLEAYQEFLLKINKNDTSTNIKIPKAKFVLIFNEQQRKWFFGDEEENRHTDNKDKLQSLLIIDESLTKVSDKKTQSLFSLPTNFGIFESSYSIATKGECTTAITNWDKKPRNIPVLLQDENNNPSFEYRETLSVLSQDNIHVYKSDFKIDEVFLTYYRLPIDIDILGYTRIDGSPSTTVDPELINKYVDEILDRCAVEVTRNYEDVSHFQLAQTRTEKS